MNHDIFLKRCFELAQIPGAAVEPNPRVGAVVVYDGRIIGEGAHEYFGGPHAEVNAIRAVSEKHLLKDCTLYVSLEPCNHHGKTPPCTSLILENGIKQVVIGAVDPNPLMAGKSVAFLRSKGIEVIVHADQTYGKRLNPHFEWNQLAKLPFVTLKWAESRDGFIAGFGADGKSEARAISDPTVSRFVHFQRQEHQAILIGRKTAAIDNPSLTTRKWPGNDPIRIVLDSDLKLDRNLRLFSNGKCIVLNRLQEDLLADVQLLKFDAPLDWEVVLKRLYSEFKIGSILVEGGAFLHQSIFQAGKWNACIRNIGQIEIGKGLAAPELPNSAQLTRTASINGDLLEFYSPEA